MGDTTMYLMLDFTLLGKHVDVATAPLASPSSPTSALPSSASDDPSFQFESLSHVLSTDASLSELMSIILSQMILASPRSSQGTKKWSADNLTILDISHHPAKVVSAIFRQFTEPSGPSSKTLRNLGWDPTGKLVVLPSPSLSSVDNADDPCGEEGLLTRYLELSAAQSVAARKPPETETDPKTRNKRQRLLLLHHASKCSAEPGQCTVTPHCAKMKDVWKHIAKCKDSYCKILYCMSSRYLLSHYRRCKPPCHICDPVKAIIHSNTSGEYGLTEGVLNPASPAPAMAEHTPPGKRQITEDPTSSSAATEDMQPNKRQKTEGAPPSDIMPPPSSSASNDPPDKPAPKTDSIADTAPPSSGDSASDQERSRPELPKSS